ncbi:MAG TPA: hydroxymethylglutaryl-CoA lyase [Acidimicrobiales bacterium]
MTERSVQMVEVGPRDGLQSEATILDTATKVELIERAIGAGIRRIEVASFVNPERVPQMAGAEEVLAALPARDDVSFIGLVLNRRGFERATQTSVDEVNVVVAVTETFSDQNQGASVDEMLAAWADIAADAHQAKIPATVVLSAAFGCPYEGEVTAGRVAEVAARVAEHGPAEITLADTIGAAAPTDVRERIDAVRAVTDVPLHVHFHNTRNTGVANVAAAVEAGVRVVDASVGGIGGCPFAPNATGNTPTEDVAYMLARMGYDTGLDLDRLNETAIWIGQQLGATVPGLLSRAGVFPPANR